MYLFNPVNNNTTTTVLVNYNLMSSNFLVFDYWTPIEFQSVVINNLSTILFRKLFLCERKRILISKVFYSLYLRPINGALEAYLIGQNFGGQKCRKFSLLPKILSAETFCPPKFCPIRYSLWTSKIAFEKYGPPARKSREHVKWCWNMVGYL